jgi:hypothetical protein
MLTLLLVLACTPKDPDTGAPPDTGGDTDSPADTDTDPADTDTDPVDTDTDTDVPLREGLAGRIGTATANYGEYQGTEEWYFFDEDEAEVCRIRYDLAQLATRQDCADCTWANDVIVSNATIVAESDVGCAAVFGDVASLDGTLYSYGYGVYYGHAEVLMVDSEKGWAAETFATWDEKTEVFSYDWSEYVPY